MCQRGWRADPGAGDAALWALGGIPRCDKSTERGTEALPGFSSSERQIISAEGLGGSEGESDGRRGQFCGKQGCRHLGKPPSCRFLGKELWERERCSPWCSPAFPQNGSCRRDGRIWLRRCSRAPVLIPDVCVCVTFTIPHPALRPSLGALRTRQKPQCPW